MKIAVLSRDERTLIELTRQLRARPGADEIDMIAGTPASLATLAETAVPDVLVVDRPHAEAGELAQIERLGHLFPRMACIALSADLSQDFLLAAMRAGVREVLPAAPSAAALDQALERIADKLSSQGAANGRVLAFISCKGGSGATFLASNLAYAMAAGGKHRVALIDMNLQFGDAALLVSDLKPLATLSDVATQIHRLDPSFLASSMVAAAPNFSILAAPSDPAHGSDVKAEHVDAILKLARRQYDFVVLDVGRSFDPVSIRALDHADTIYPVLQTSLPYVRDGKRLMGMFRNLGYARDKIAPVVNRHDGRGAVRIEDLEQALDSAIPHRMPNHYEAAASSVDQGVPILRLHADSPLSASLSWMARGITGEAAARPAPGFVARLLKRRAA